jgi:hypothetical protein
MTAAALTQDLKLLDFLESLPLDTEAEPDVTHLCARLTALCAVQAMDASEARIRSAVNHYLAHRLPVSDQPVRWCRPTTMTEWEQVKAELQADHDHFAKVEQRWWSAGWVSFGVTFISDIWGITRDATPTTAPFSFCIVIFGFWATVLMRPMYCGYKAWIWSRCSWMKKARSNFKIWTGSDRISPDSVQGLAAMEPDVERLGRWLASPRTAAALRQIAKSSVPVTQRDAALLDHLANQERSAQKAQNQDRVWNESLQQLAAD